MKQSRASVAPSFARNRIEIALRRDAPRIDRGRGQRVGRGGLWL